MRLIAASVAVGPTHGLLGSLVLDGWTAQQVDDHHEVFMLHGQKVCFFRSPACGRCVLLDLCPIGQTQTTADASSHEPRSGCRRSEQ